jgi:oxygen-independent coproporphyrinogen-3 oxidase
MCNLEIPIPEMERTHAIEFMPHFQAALKALRPLREAGFVTVDDAAIRVTERGRVLVRNAAMVFDPYLAQDDMSGPRYSRTV